MPNRLKLLRTYLVGAMDRVPDGGVEWRAAITPWLQERGVIVLDPTNKAIEIGIEDSQARLEIERLKQIGEFDQIRPRFQDIALVDLRMVDMADFLVVNLDLDTHPCGTYEEIFTANRSKKPIIIHIEQGKVNVPNWLLFRLPHQMIFSTWKNLKNYLDSVDKDGTIESYNRWRFFDLEQQTRQALKSLSEIVNRP